MMERVKKEAAQIRRDGWDSIIEQWSHGEGDNPFRLGMYAAWENPDAAFQAGDDENFLVVVPFSGGLDSTTALVMALEAGLPVVPVYVDTGAGYAAAEIEACRQLVKRLDYPLMEPLQVVTVDVNYRKHMHHDTGRNAIIIARLLDWFPVGTWGEIWFSSTATWGECPHVGGDKSWRWIADMQALIYALGCDARINTPVGGLTKADEVEYLVQHVGLQFALDARSCYANDEGHCGRCLACFKRAIAFGIAGYGSEVLATYPNGVNFSECVNDMTLDDRNSIYRPERMLAPIGYTRIEGWA